MPRGLANPVAASSADTFSNIRCQGLSKADLREPKPSLRYSWKREVQMGNHGWELCLELLIFQRALKAQMVLIVYLGVLLLVPSLRVSSSVPLGTQPCEDPGTFIEMPEENS